MSKSSDQNLFGDALKETIGSLRLEKGLNIVRAEEAWQNAMGETIMKYTTDVKLQGETLLVRVSSSVLREELSYGNQKIIQLLNKELGSELIKKLVLR